jgi:ribonuclease HI
MRGTHNFISFSLEFYCSSNTIEYEALVQVLKKSIDLKITKKIRLFGDSDIIAREIKNTIHFNSPHLTNHQ